MMLLPKITPQTDEQRAAAARRQLIRREAQFGGTLFGTVPAGHRREFFCLDSHTWVWHEEWNEQGQRHVLTTHYNMRPDGIIKSQGDGKYQRLSQTEATNLYNAIQLYCQRVIAGYQQRHVAV